MRTLLSLLLLLLLLLLSSSSRTKNPAVMKLHSTTVSAATDRPAQCTLQRFSAWQIPSIAAYGHQIISSTLPIAAEYRSRWWVWSTVVRRPSEVYDTNRLTKLTAPETISRSRDNGGCPPKFKWLTWPNHSPFPGWFANRRLALATVNLPTKSNVSNSTRYEDMKGDTKCQKWGGLE